MFAMAVFNKSPPKFVDDEVIKIYSRFAKFAELRTLIRQTRGSSAMLKKVADAARWLGQFEVARQLYEEVGAHEDLFSLFALARSAHNLAVLASRSVLARPIEAAFGIGPKSGQYEPLPNLQLPRIRTPHVAEEFTLYVGDATESSPLFPPSFDELNDFGISEYSITGEEMDATLPQYESSTGPSVPPTSQGQPEDGERPSTSSADADATPVSKPPEIDNTDMKMTKFFEDGLDEPKAPTVSFEFKKPEPGTTRRRGVTVAARRGKVPFSLGENSGTGTGTGSQGRPPPQARTLDDIVPPSTSIEQAEDFYHHNEADDSPQSPATQYTSSLFI
jgi:hypothetical protein